MLFTLQFSLHLMVFPQPLVFKGFCTIHFLRLPTATMTVITVVPGNAGFPLGMSLPLHTLRILVSTMLVHVGAQKYKPRLTTVSLLHCYYSRSTGVIGWFTRAMKLLSSRGVKAMVDMLAERGGGAR